MAWTLNAAITNVTVPAVDVGTPTPTYAATGEPAGISFNTATRIIFGTPTSTGSGTITITATNSAGSRHVDSRLLDSDTTAQIPPRPCGHRLLARSRLGQRRDIRQLASRHLAVRQAWHLPMQAWAQLRQPTNRAVCGGNAISHARQCLRRIRSAEHRITAVREAVRGAAYPLHDGGPLRGSTGPVDRLDGQDCEQGKRQRA